MRITIEPNCDFEFESGQRAVSVSDVNNAPSLILYTDVRDLMIKALLAWGFTQATIDRLFHGRD